MAVWAHCRTTAAWRAFRKLSAASLTRTTARWGGVCGLFVQSMIVWLQEYLFFPAKSRFTFAGVEADDALRLEKSCNEVVRGGLELDRIRPGLGDPGECKCCTLIH